MPKNIVNITLSVVTEEVEMILESYPQYPYQQTFSHSGLRQDLIAYVLSRVPNKYTAIDSGESVSNQTVQVRCSSEQLLHIENLIHTGIGDLLHSQQKVDYCLREEVKFDSRVASWFR
jgi:Late competence development protein ComFB